jgi:hypothetical protein
MVGWASTIRNSPSAPPTTSGAGLGWPVRPAAMASRVHSISARESGGWRRRTEICHSPSGGRNHPAGVRGRCAAGRSSSRPGCSRGGRRTAAGPARGELHAAVVPKQGAKMGPDGRQVEHSASPAPWRDNARAGGSGAHRCCGRGPHRSRLRSRGRPSGAHWMLPRASLPSCSATASTACRKGSVGKGAGPAGVPSTSLRRGASGSGGSRGGDGRYRGRKVIAGSAACGAILARAAASAEGRRLRPDRRVAVHRRSRLP